MEEVDDTVRMDAPLAPDIRISEEGLNEAATPEAETVAERPTVPTNPLRLVNVTVEVPEDP